MLVEGTVVFTRRRKRGCYVHLDLFDTLHGVRVEQSISACGKGNDGKRKEFHFDSYSVIIVRGSIVFLRDLCNTFGMSLNPTNR